MPVEGKHTTLGDFNQLHTMSNEKKLNYRHTTPHFFAVIIQKKVYFASVFVLHIVVRLRNNGTCSLAYSPHMQLWFFLQVPQQTHIYVTHLISHINSHWVYMYSVCHSNASLPPRERATNTCSINNLVLTAQRREDREDQSRVRNRKCFVGFKGYTVVSRLTGVKPIIIKVDGVV